MKLRSMMLVTALSLGALPLAAQGGRRVQVFSESFSMAAKGPYFVHLDSGATYLIVREGQTAGDITVAPRSNFGAPVRFSAANLSEQGVPFIAATSGDYRIDYAFDPSHRDNEIAHVRIFRQVSASEEAACAGNTSTPCTVLSSDEEPRHHRVSPAVWVMLGLFPAFLYGVFRNGKSF